MRNILLLTLLFGLSSITLNAEDSNSTKDKNSTKEDITQKQIKEQMEREKKYAKEQIFYQGSDYNLSSSEVNEKSLSSIPLIEPDYDFNMDDAYSDEQ
jgi:hypothetical protein